MKLLHEKESERVLGLIFDVRNQMKGGWGEEIYHQALVARLLDEGVPTLSKPRRTLVHRGVDLYTFEPDIIVWEKIILELKVLPTLKNNMFPTANEAQIIWYLKRFEKELGILVNFAHPKVGIKRMAYQPREMTIAENYDRIKQHLSNVDRDVLVEIRRHILRLARFYGTGYPEIVYRQMIALEFGHQGIDCISEVNIPARWREKDIGTQVTQHLLVDNRFLLLVRANLDLPPAYDYLRTRTYLKALGLKMGLVINFGRSQLQIHSTAVK